MSLFSTITQGEAPGLKGVSPRGLGTLALILVAGMALGYGISAIDFSSQPEAAVYQSMNLAEFLRVNTEAYEDLAPIIPETPKAVAEARVDPFIWANIGSYATLNQPWQVASEFTAVNTQLPVYGPYDMAEAARFDRFVAINTHAYQGLDQAWHVDSAFLEINTNLGTTYTEPTSGPR